MCFGGPNASTIGRTNETTPSIIAKRRRKEDVADVLQTRITHTFKNDVNITLFAKSETVSA